MSGDNNKLQAMMAQLQGALKQGTPKKPKVTAEPQVEEPIKRGVGPDPGNIVGIDDVETREGTVSEIAELAEQAAQRTGQQKVASPEDVTGPLEDDPELAELLASVDSGSADLDGNAEVEALVEEPADSSEDVTQEAGVGTPVEADPTGDVEKAIEAALAEPEEEPAEAATPEEEQLPSFTYDDFSTNELFAFAKKTIKKLGVSKFEDLQTADPALYEALIQRRQAKAEAAAAKAAEPAPSSAVKAPETKADAPEPEMKAEEVPQRETAASVSAVAAQVMEQVNAAVDAKLEPLRAQLAELKSSVDSAVADVSERMGRLAESTVGMDTFNSFFMDDFAPVLEAVEKVDAMEGQVNRIEEDLKGVNAELSGDEGTVVKLANELDALRTKVANETVSSEMWNQFLEEEYLPVAELRDQIEELNLPGLAKAWQELSVKWEELVGTDAERIPGMVHAHREASVVVAVEILRNTTEDNFHRLQDFVSDYGQAWVKDVMSYLAENPEVIRDKVALAKYNVIYDHMAASAKLQSYKPKVDTEVQRVIGFAQQLTGDS